MQIVLRSTPGSIEVANYQIQATSKAAGHSSRVDTSSSLSIQRVDHERHGIQRTFQNLTSARTEDSHGNRKEILPRR